MRLPATEETPMLGGMASCKAWSWGCDCGAPGARRENGARLPGSCGQEATEEREAQSRYYAVRWKPTMGAGCRTWPNRLICKERGQQ
eukprot:11532938-Prorocentrum_lima.AAC.1